MNNGGARSVQVLCLCLVALCLSAPLNGLSPSLSMVARDLGFDERGRDTYLGGYISLATMLGTMIGSIIAGSIVDMWPRKLLLSGILVIGGLTTILFGLMEYFLFFLILRVFTGFCQGAVVPLIFSLIGDLFSSDERGSVSAIVSSCLGGGMMLGQLFVGFFLSVVGWRMPFVIMGMVSLSVLCIVRWFLIDPVRGGKESEVAIILSQGINLPPLTIKRFLNSIMVPSVAIMIVQTVPNTIPWGVLSSHLHDMLATDAHLSMPQATFLIGMFGLGAALGGLFGGLLGARLYQQGRVLLPVFMGVSMALSAVLLKLLLTMDLTAPGTMNLAVPVLLTAGALAAVNGANIRSLVLNLTSPEARGAAIALLNFANSAGRGVGPILIEGYMSLYSSARRPAVVFFLHLWFVSGSLLCLACLTVVRDEEVMKQSLKTYAEGAAQQACRKLQYSTDHVSK